MCIHQYAFLLRVHIIIPVLLIKNSVIMCIRKYALVRICINALLRIRIIVSQTVQGHCPDRICILVHCAQPICIIFMNTHYNGFFTSTLKTDSEHWTPSLKTESEKNSPLHGRTTYWVHEYNLMLVFCWLAGKERYKLSASREIYLCCISKQ